MTQHLIALADQGEQRGADRLGGADGNQHLGIRIVHQAIAGRSLLGDGIAQLRDARPGWVLVVPARDGRSSDLEHPGWAVGVREALAEVHRAGTHRQRGHLSEDRRAERSQPGNQSMG